MLATQPLACPLNAFLAFLSHRLAQGALVGGWGGGGAEEEGVGPGVCCHKRWYEKQQLGYRTSRKGVTGTACRVKHQGGRESKVPSGTLRKTQ